MSHVTHIWMSHVTHIWMSHVTHTWMSHVTHIWMSHVTHIWMSHVTHIWMSHVTHTWMSHVTHTWMSHVTHTHVNEVSRRSHVTWHIHISMCATCLIHVCHTYVCHTYVCHTYVMDEYYITCVTRDTCDTRRICVTHVWHICETYVTHMCDTYVWHIVKHMCDMWHHASCVIYETYMCHTHVCVTHVIEVCRKHGWVVWHIWMSHGTHMNRSLLRKMTCKDKAFYASSPPCSKSRKWVLSHIWVLAPIWLSHAAHVWRCPVIHMDESYDPCKCVNVCDVTHM